MSFWGVNLLFKYNLIVLLNDFSLYVPFQKTLNYLCYLSNYETVQIFCCLFIIINFIPLFFFCKVWNRQLSLSLHCCPKIQLLVLMLCWNMTMWWRIGEAPTSQQRGLNTFNTFATSLNSTIVKSRRAKIDHFLFSKGSGIYVRRYGPKGK